MANAAITDAQTEVAEKAAVRRTPAWMVFTAGLVLSLLVWHLIDAPTLAYVVLSLGVLISVLLWGLVASLATTSARAMTLAERMTEDLRQSEAKLAQSQKMTQELIEALPNPVFFKGSDARYRGVNKAWESFFGIPREKIIGKTVDALHPDDPQVAKQLAAMDDALWASPGTQTYDAQIRTADGTRHDVTYYNATYGVDEGRAVGLVGTVVDITQRKHAEAQQAMVHAITRVLAEEENVPAAMAKILETICTAMGWDYGARWEYDKDADVLRYRESWSVKSPQMREFADAASQRSVSPRPAGEGVVRRIYAANKPLWISDLTKAAGLERSELIAKAGLHGAFGFPLLKGAEALGVMEFFHRDVREPDAAFLQIAESVGSQIGQYLVRMRVEAAVKFVALHDSLTGLPNRAMFLERLEHAIAQGKRHKRSLAIMFIDLDRFKVINDTLGHEAGDVLLKEVAQRLTEALRATDTVGRLGGDEFVILLEEIPNPADVAVVAQKLLSGLGASFLLAQHEYHVTASIGVSMYPDDSEDASGLLKNADIAMYRAKEQGRNSFQFYSAQMNVHSFERLSLETGLRRALEQDELVLHYQPQKDIRSGRITGMEALVRWEHPELGLLAPGKFISIAEETGLIVQIGHWVLKTACAAQAKWREMGLPKIRIAVNLSARQFIHGTLAEDIAQVLEETGCDADSLELEITESMVMHDPGRAIKLLNDLKAKGIRIAMDDFGTGYSSLAYLKRFPIDNLKIDRSFVSDIPGDSGDVAITQAIIAMAHSLLLKVIAEGVETEGQLNFLHEQGCDEMQGYYYSPPLPLEEATELLRQS